jgi:hypothetical protein
VKTSSTANLESRGGGSACRILYKESGTGVKKAVVSMNLACAFDLFPVNLTQTGGSNGNKTTAATWSYTVNDLASNQLATGVSPTKPRPSGTMTAAGTGVCYYSGATLVLWDTNEYPGTGGCP